MSETVDAIKAMMKTTTMATIANNSTTPMVLPARMRYLMEQGLPILNLVFIIFGSVGNLLTFMLLVRRNVRKHSSMRYLAALCLIDTCCLYTWNFSLVYKFFTGKKVEHENALVCRLFAFFSYFILQSSSWLIVAIGFDRLLTFIFKKENKLTRLIHNTKFLIACTVLTIFLFNFVVLINNAVPTKPVRVFIESNNSFIYVYPKWTYNCYEPHDFYFVWDIVHIIMYSILPFCIILIENVILAFLTMRHARQMKKSFGQRPLVNILSPEMPIDNVENDPETNRFVYWIQGLFDKRKRVYRKRVDLRQIKSKESKNRESVAGISIQPDEEETVTFARTFTQVLVTQAKRNKRQQSKGSQVANLLLFLTVSFVIATVPYSTFYALKVNLNIDPGARNILVNVLSLLQYLRHAANFLIYLFTSSIIKQELRFIYIHCHKRIRDRR